MKKIIYSILFGILIPLTAYSCQQGLSKSSSLEDVKIHLVKEKKDEPLKGKILVLPGMAHSRGDALSLYENRKLCEKKALSNGILTQFINLRGNERFDDITSLKKIIDASSTPPLVLHGLSLGAVTAINTLGAHTFTNPDGSSKIAGLVAMSPFAQFDDILTRRNSCGLTCCLPRCLSHLIAACCISCCCCDAHCYCQNYNPQGPQPINSIRSPHQPKKMLFLASQYDSTVPFKSTTKLVKAAAEAKGREIFFAHEDCACHFGYLDNPVCIKLIKDFNTYAFGGACSELLGKYRYASPAPLSKE